MKILLTLDFPPQHGGIQLHLHGIVSHTYTNNDLVIAGCQKNGASGKAGLCPVRYASSALSFVNTKFSLIPVFFLTLKAIFTYDNITIECGNVYCALIPWIISRFTKRHYRVYVHGTEIIGLSEKTLQSNILKYCLSKAELIIANSKYTAGLIEHLQLRIPVTVLTPKIELPVLATPHSSDQSALRILSVGRLVEHKGHCFLIDAVSMLPPNIQWHLVIAGNGPLLNSLETQCKENNITDKVTFMTNATDEQLAKEYSTASIFVLPSIEKCGTEGFGMVLLEAMGFYIPIIAAKTGGIPEVLDNGECGILVQAKSSIALRDAITKLHANPSLRQALVIRAHERLVTNYVWK